MNAKPLTPPLSLAENAQSYFSFLVRTLKANFAYKSSTILGLFTASMVYGITVLIWSHVYSQQGNTMTVPKMEMFAYLALAFSLNYALNINIDQRIGQRIRTGLIATDLLKPVNFQLAQAMQALSDCLFNSFISIGILAGAFLALGPLVLPASPAALGLFLISLFLGFFIQYSIVFIFVQGAFYTYSGYGIFASRIALHQTFSGLQAPLVLYPPVLLSIGQWLPFQHIIYTPIYIYLGRVDISASLNLLGQQALWALGLYIVGHFAMRKAIYQLEIQGG